MTVRIIHTADTHLRSDERFDVQTPEDLFDTLKRIVELTKENLSYADESALVHTGDVFDNPDPSEELVNRVINLFNSYTVDVDNPPRLLFIAGNHDTTEDEGTTPALDRVIEETDAEYLTQNPTVLGNNDIALYGVQAYENERLRGGDLSFELPPQDTPTALCLHDGVGKDESQSAVNFVPTKTSIPELDDLVPFRLTMMLCGHIHTQVSDSYEMTERVYAGAPDRVRENLKDTGPRSVNCFEVRGRNPQREDPIESTKIATRARPWIELEHIVTDKTEPEDIVEDVVSEWEMYVHDKFPQLDDEYAVLYSKEDIKPPIVDIELDGLGESGVPTGFAFALIDKLKDWGHAYAIKIDYDAADGPSRAVIGAGNVGRLGPDPPDDFSP